MPSPPKTFPTPGLLGTRHEELAPVLGSLIGRESKGSEGSQVKKNSGEQKPPKQSPAAAATGSDVTTNTPGK